MKVGYFLLLNLYSVFVSNGEKETEESDRKKALKQLTRSRTVLLDDYHLVTRHVATDVYMYRSYRTVAVIFYPVMRDVRDARFTFQSEELHMNKIGSCEPNEVIVNLKLGAFPAVNPDGYDFPKDFIDPGARGHIYTIKLLSDGKNTSYSIKNPKPGNWYALVYIKWEDPRTQKVEQQGLVADCNTILYTDLQVHREENIKLINCYMGLRVDFTQIPILFKCMTVDNILPISLNISIHNTTTVSSELQLRVQALSLPSDEGNLISCAFDPKIENSITVTFSPHPSTWHYIKLDHVIGNSSHNIADCESYLRSGTDEADNGTVLSLMRDGKDSFFSFDYGLPTTDIHDSTSLVNLTSNEIKTLRFKVNQFVDIGGTLIIEAVLLIKNPKYYMGYRRELKKNALLSFTEENQFFRTVICMDIGHPSIPLESGHCQYNDRVKPALFVLNSTDSESISEKIIIPFPEGGTWYLTLRLFCDEVVCPCRTSDNGTQYYVDARGVDTGSKISSESWNNTREGETDCNTTVLLSIASKLCVNGQCSNRGSCQLNTFGGLVMSFCSCPSGYGGWDCSDKSRMDSELYMRISVLLLTLSNLLFFISIYVSIIRLYFTEAIIYTFTMAFSTFYHACDAPVQVAYCIIRGNILQFGDFYCGIMSFWVTLLAMSIIGDKFRSSLQLTGAIVIALLTTWNMRSFVAFLIPVAIGVFLLLLSWYLDFRKNRKMRFPKNYYVTYLPLGIVLVTLGLISFGFLQTEQNYKIVHSIWHMIIAVSVVFLLPDVKRNNCNPFLPSPGICNLPFGKMFSRNQSLPPTDNHPD